MTTSQPTNFLNSRLIIAINCSGEFSSGEKKFANTVAIMVLASVSGGAAGGLVGGGWAGAGLGGLAGGIVGGVGYESPGCRKL